MTDAMHSFIVRFSISNQLTKHTLDQLEHDLQQYYPGTRLVAVYDKHCDWEAEVNGNIWNKQRGWFLNRYKGSVEVLLNPSDPRLDTDIYNIGLLFNPTLPLALPLRHFEYAPLKVGEIFHGPFHGLGFWWRVIERDLGENVLLCLPAPPPVSRDDGVPRFLYRLQSRVFYKAGQIEYWCPMCWRDTYSLDGVIQVSLADLIEPQLCTMCGRDFCADDARAPEWAAYFWRFEWRRPRPQ